MAQKPRVGSAGDGSADPVAEIEAMDFEHASGELESIIDRIEAGQLGLEESLKQYERGVALHAHCRRILDRVEQRIVELNPEGAKAGEKGKG